MNSVLEGKAVSSRADQESILGYLFWYSLSDGDYDRETLRKALLDNYLDERLLPKQIRKRDAFKRATKAVERKRVEQDEETKHQYRNYIVRNVKTSGDLLQRNIVVEEVDQQGQKLEYESDASCLFFNQKSEQFYFHTNTSDMMVEQLVEEADELFNKYCTHHTGQTVRMSILNMVKAMSPTPVRPSGGVYFIPAKHQHTLTNVKGFLKSIKGEGFMLPVINDEEGRDMVQEKLKQHIDKIYHDCFVALRSPEMTRNQMYGALSEATRVVRDFKDYKQMVSIDVDNIETKIDMIQEQIMAMHEKEWAKR